MLIIGLTFLNKIEKLCITNASLSDGILCEISLQSLLRTIYLAKMLLSNSGRRRSAKHKDFDEAIKSLIEIQLGDPIVHEQYGVGRYLRPKKS